MIFTITAYIIKELHGIPRIIVGNAGKKNFNKIATK